MAAAGFSSSRAATGFTATRGLFLIFTLLCLVCVASSLVDKNQLEQLKEKLEEAQKRADRIKENYKTEMASSSEHMDETISILDQMIVFVKKTMTSDDDLPPVKTYLENVKGYIQKTKAYIDSKNEKLGAEIEEIENKLGKMKNLIKFLEENHDEL